MDRERFEAIEKRQEIFEDVEWKCEVCGNFLRLGVPQLAHRIPKSKENLAKYSEVVIHHRQNLVAVCSLDCNSAVNIGNCPREVERLAASIMEILGDYDN